MPVHAPPVLYLFIGRPVLVFPSHRGLAGLFIHTVDGRIVGIAAIILLYGQLYLFPLVVQQGLTIGVH